MEKIDCKKIADEWLAETATRVEKFKKRCDRQPRLVTFLLSNDPASQRYVRNKKKDCEAVGIENIVIPSMELEVMDNFKIPGIDFEVEIDCEGAFAHISRQIQTYTGSWFTDAIMIQLPIDKRLGLDSQDLIRLISRDMDVDCLTSVNMGRLALGDNSFMPATPRGIMYLFEHEGYDLTGKNVVIRGRSNIVGKPLALAMINADATVQVENSKSEWNMRVADVIIDATGTPCDYWVSCDYFIDVSTFLGEDGKLRGSLDAKCAADGLYDIEKYTSVPGGVGLLTRAALCANVMDCAEGNL